VRFGGSLFGGNRLESAGICYGPAMVMPMLVASMAASTIGAGVGAYGAIESGEAASASASYQAQVAANDAQIADQNAQYATAAGNAQASQQQLKTAAQIGAIRAAQAANGLDVNSGSDLDVQSSAKELGELDTLTIQNNAARQAYGYETQSMSYTAQSGLDTAQSGQALTAGTIGGVGSILGGVSSVGSQYMNYQLLGALNSNTVNPYASPGP
jgi:hypothetical protein